MDTQKLTRRLLLCVPAVMLALLLFAAAGQGAGTPKPPRIGPPSVSTGNVHLQGVTTTLQGAVNPRGLPTSYYFQYGPTVAYGKQTAPGTLPAGNVKVNVGQVAPVLAGYHYRLVALNSASATPKLGKDRTFSLTKSRKATKFNIDKPTEATVYGGAASLSGLLTGTGNAGRKLVLQESPYPFLTAFATVGVPVITSASGAFTFHVARLTKSTQYRVSTLDPRPIYSPLVTLQAAYRVTLKVKTSSHKGLVRLYGTVTPAIVGAKVSFQLRKAVRPGKSEKASERTSKFATQFGTTSKHGTATVSRFSAIVKVLKGGSYRARVEPSKAGSLVAGNSPTVLLHSASKR